MVENFSHRFSALSRKEAVSAGDQTARFSFPVVSYRTNVYEGLYVVNVERSWEGVILLVRGECERMSHTPAVGPRASDPFPGCMRGFDPLFTPDTTQMKLNVPRNT